MNSELVSISRLMSPLNTPVPTSALLHDPSAARSSDLLSPFACIFMAFPPCRSDFGLASSRAPKAMLGAQVDFSRRFPCEPFRAPASAPPGPGEAPLAPPRCRRFARTAVQGCGGPLFDDDVVAGAAVEDVLPGTADQHVVTCFAIESVSVVAADEHVVAVAAIDDELGGASREPRRLDDVIAGKGVDHDPI